MIATKVNKVRHIKRRRMILYIAVPIASSCFVFLYLYNFERANPLVPSVSTATNKPAVLQEVLVPVSPPIRISIPAAGVDTTIKPVGLTADGDMAIDDDPDTVAWYEIGPKPGEKGSAVIAGHYGWKDGHGSIFNNLNTLKAGDRISIDNQAGVQTNFIVREVRTYNPEADATAVFKSTDAKAHLNLISCIGTWVTETNSYSERLVVFSDLE